MISDEYKIESYETVNVSANLAITTTSWVAERFHLTTPAGVQVSSFTITQAWFRGTKTAGTGNWLIRIYANDVATNKPTGSPLAEQSFDVSTLTGSVAWASVTFTTPVTLNPALSYHLVVAQTVAGGGVASVNVDTSGSYSGGNELTSTSGGSLWSVQAARDVPFQIFGYYESGGVAFDASASLDATGLTSLSLSHTVANIDDYQYLLVLLVLRETSGATDPGDAVCTAMAFNSVPMALVGDSGWGPSYERVMAYGLIAPSVGTFNVTATLSSVNWAGRMVSVGLHGVDQLQPINDAGVAAQTDVAPVSFAATSSQLDWLVEGLAWTGGATATTAAGNGGTREQLVNATNSGLSLLKYVDGAGSYSVPWTLSGSSSYAQLALAVRGALSDRPNEYRPAGDGFLSGGLT